MTWLGWIGGRKTAGVALLQDGELFYESRLCAGFTHSETLLPLCEEALRACRLSLQDIFAFGRDGRMIGSLSPVPTCRRG